MGPTIAEKEEAAIHAYKVEYSKSHLRMPSTEEVNTFLLAWLRCQLIATTPEGVLGAMEQVNNDLEAASDRFDQVLVENHPVGNDPDKVLSNSMTIHALEAEVLVMVPELRQSVLMDEFNTQDHETREQVYAAADAKVRPIYLQILELLAKAHGFESYEAALEEQERDAFERADEKFYGGV